MYPKWTKSSVAISISLTGRDVFILRQIPCFTLLTFAMLSAVTLAQAPFYAFYYGITAHYTVRMHSFSGSNEENWISKGKEPNIQREAEAFEQERTTGQKSERKRISEGIFTNYEGRKFKKDLEYSQVGRSNKPRKEAYWTSCRSQPCIRAQPRAFVTIPPPYFRLLACPQLIPFSHERSHHFPRSSRLWSSSSKRRLSHLLIGIIIHLLPVNLIWKSYLKVTARINLWAPRWQPRLASQAKRLFQEYDHAS